MLSKRELSAITGYLYKDAKLMLSTKLGLWLHLLSILFAVTTYFFMGNSLSSTHPTYQGLLFEFLLVGIMTSTLLTSVMNGLVSSLTIDMQNGVLEHTLCSKRPPIQTFIYMSLWNVIQATVIALLYFIIGRYWFDAQITLSRFLPLFIITLLSLLSFLALGIIAAAFILRYKRGSPIQWALSSLQILLGGVYYPIEQLPGWLKSFAYMLPLSHSVRAMRATLIVSDQPQSTWGSIVLLTLLAAILWPLAYFTLQRTLTYIRLHGSFLQS